MQMQKLLAVLSLTLASLPVQAQDIALPPPRPFEQMKGDCSAFAMDIGREAAAWAAGPIRTIAAGTDPQAATPIAVGELSRVGLHPHAEVRFPVPPEQDRSTDSTFSGHLRVTIPTAGLWRVAASNGLWFDMVVAGARVPSAAFEMQTGCTAPFKVVVFDLPAGEALIQFNGSRSAEVEVLLLPWAAE